MGGGQIGLTVALGLARAGRPVTVVPGGRSARPSPVVLHPLVHSFLDELGVLPDLERVGTAWRHLVVRAPDERVRIDVGGGSDPDRVAEGSTAGGSPECLTLVREGYLHVLDRAVRDAGGRILDGALFVALEEAVDGEVTIRVRDPDGEFAVVGRNLVAADGTRSAVRQCLGIGFPGITWRHVLGQVTVGAGAGVPEAAAGATYRMRPPMLELRTPDGGVHVALGLGGTDPGESRAEQVRRLLPAKYAAAAQLVDVQTMHERCASVLHRGSVLLAGDAAHVTSPLTEYSGIGGLFGAAAAVDAVLAAQAGDDTALARYSVERRRAYKLFLRPLVDDVLGQIFWPADRAAEEATVSNYRLLANDPEALREHLQLAQHLRHDGVPDAR